MISAYCDSNFCLFGRCAWRNRLQSFLSWDSSRCRWSHLIPQLQTHRPLRDICRSIFWLWSNLWWLLCGCWFFWGVRTQSRYLSGEPHRTLRESDSRRHRLFRSYDRFQLRPAGPILLDLPCLFLNWKVKVLGVVSSYTQ